MIGKLINKLRKERKMTLVELANKSGVALATLSRVENGKMTGTLESHMKICDAFEITLPELYKNLYLPKKAVDLHNRKAAARVFVHDKKYSEEMLASKIPNKKMMPILIKISKGGKTHIEETKPGIEKFVYIAEGRIEASVGEEKYNLMRSDTLYFEAHTPHFFKNLSNHESRLLCVISPPMT